MEPFGDLTPDAVEETFTKQAEVLAEGGCDLIWIETIFAFDELGAAIRGAMKSGLPVASTMTFDTASRTMMGDTPQSAFEFVHNFDPGLIAFGANCGAGPSMLIDTVVGLCEAATTTTWSLPRATAVCRRWWTARSSILAPGGDGRLRETGTRLRRAIVGGCAARRRRFWLTWSRP